MEDLVNRVEALLFLSPTPLRIEEIAKHTGVSAEEVKAAVEELRRRYEGTALVVEEFVDSYRLNVRPEYRGLAHKLGLLPEFTRSELRVIAELLKRGELRLSEIKKRIKGWKEFLSKLRAYGFVVTLKKGRSVIIRKTKLLDRYFSFTRENG